MKIKIEKCSSIHLQTTKIHQRRITNKTGISLEIIVNVFTYLIVSLVLLKFLLWQQHHFQLFQLESSVNLLWFQVRTFYCPSGRRDALFFLWKQMYTFIITNTDKKFKCAIMLLIRQSSTSKLQFIFGFNGCLRAIFPLLSFKNFLLYTWDEVV